MIYQIPYGPKKEKAAIVIAHNVREAKETLNRRRGVAIRDMGAAERVAADILVADGMLK